MKTNWPIGRRVFRWVSILWKNPRVSFLRYRKVKRELKKMLWKIIGNEKQYILSKFLGQFKVLNTHIFIKCCMRHLYISLMHLICPPKFSITFVFHFSWILHPSQKKLKTVLMQNVGDTFKVHYGRCASGVCLAVFLKTLSPDGPSDETAFFRQKISPK